MGSVIISMPKYEDALRLSDSLSGENIDLEIEVCQNAAEVLRVSNDRDFGVVICTKNLKNMSHIELSEYLPSDFGMIVMTKDVGLETYNDNTVKLMMPFKTRELVSTIEMMLSQYFRKIRKKDKGPNKRSEAEQKIIEEAKALLIERNGMTEPEAFRYIQKSSMDQGRTMAESAQMIIMLNV